MERKENEGKKNGSKATSKEGEERNGRRKEKDGKTNGCCKDISELAGNEFDFYKSILRGFCPIVYQITKTTFSLSSMNQASIDERKKAKREEERQQKLEAKQKQEENEIEKRENAEAAFKAWKEHKNNIEKERRGRFYRYLSF